MDIGSNLDPHDSHFLGVVLISQCPDLDWHGGVLSISSQLYYLKNFFFNFRFFIARLLNSIWFKGTPTKSPTFERSGLNRSGDERSCLERSGIGRSGVLKFRLQTVRKKRSGFFFVLNFNSQIYTYIFSWNFITSIWLLTYVRVIRRWAVPAAHWPERRGSGPRRRSPAAHTHRATAPLLHRQATSSSSKRSLKTSDADPNLNP